jgi:hypothetical protein
MKNKIKSGFLREYCKEKMVRKKYKIFLTDSEVDRFEGIVQNAFELPRETKDQRLLNWIQDQIEAISEGKDIFDE